MNEFHEITMMLRKYDYDYVMNLIKTTYDYDYVSWLRLCNVIMDYNMIMNMYYDYDYDYVM